ncbi:MAG: DUF2270 domain-containing protein [bacterium]|nr:DUF2270 domain-containing protein [bacterium]
MTNKSEGRSSGPDEPEPRILSGPKPREGEAAPSSEPHVDADYESSPLSRQEYIAAIVHLYRGELHRANAWRIRLDNTTNWAVLTVAGLLSLSFSEGEHSHWILLIGMAIVTVFLSFEARRFRMADVWRARVRKIEYNFYGPILRRDPVSPQAGWGNMVAEDLFDPHFKISRSVAFRIRFTRNYWAIYLILLFAWCMHVVMRPDPAQSLEDLMVNLSKQTPLLPWWTPVAYVGVFVVAIIALLTLTPRIAFQEMDYWKYEPDEHSGESLIDL